MRAHFFAVTVLSTALTITSASATVLINGDNGGLMEDYTARFQQASPSSSTAHAFRPAPWCSG